MKYKAMEGQMEVILPRIYKKLEKCLKKNKGGDKYFYPDEVSLVNTRDTKMFFNSANTSTQITRHLSVYFQITLADFHSLACCEAVL